MNSDLMPNLTLLFFNFDKSVLVLIKASLILTLLFDEVSDSNKFTAGDPIKYPPPKSPKSPADKLNSDIRLGEMVAVIALNKLEI